MRLTLAPGKYSLEVEVPECKGSSIPVAECSLSYQIVKVSDTSGREKEECHLAQVYELRISKL